MLITKVLCAVDYYTGSTVLILVAVALMLIGFIVQAVMRSRFKKYSNIATMQGKATYEVIQEILYKNDCSAAVVPTGGSLTDHYDPRNNTISLSQPVYNSNSVAALAVAAHETGHALQHKEGYAPIKIRNSILPVANLGARFAPIIVIVGFMLSYYNLAMIGVYLYAAVLGFQLVTLPVEFNASSRAITLLTDGGYLQRSEVHGARKVLTMAAMTYVVSTLITIVSLLRLVLIASGSRRRS